MPAARVAGLRAGAYDPLMVAFDAPKASRRLRDAGFAERKAEAPVNGSNQRDETALTFTCKVLVPKRPA